MIAIYSKETNMRLALVDIDDVTEELEVSKVICELLRKQGHKLFTSIDPLQRIVYMNKTTVIPVESFYTRQVSGTKMLRISVMHLTQITEADRAHSKGTISTAEFACRINDIFAAHDKRCAEFGLATPYDRETVLIELLTLHT